MTLTSGLCMHALKCAHATAYPSHTSTGTCAQITYIHRIYVQFQWVSPLFNPEQTGYHCTVFSCLWSPHLPGHMKMLWMLSEIDDGPESIMSHEWSQGECLALGPTCPPGLFWLLCRDEVPNIFSILSVNSECRDSKKSPHVLVFGGERSKNRF